ncbi:4701_t:CDS:2 [Ambispora leptoticha]|uniref:4701_t:CDS:1 n=1 Tax=Ambispora leptoticha TaxID=144679 RepID=A0A9N9ENX5_9GLOM|nr:4701_t:CDS:2 [Ambispora leptoticha]
MNYLNSYPQYVDAQITVTPHGDNVEDDDKAKAHIPVRPPPPLPPRTNDNKLVAGNSTSQDDQLLPPLPPRNPKGLRNAADVNNTSRTHHNNYNINGSDDIEIIDRTPPPLPPRKLSIKSGKNNSTSSPTSPIHISFSHRNRRFDTWFETRHPTIRQYKKALYVALVLFVIGVVVVILLAVIGKFNGNGPGIGSGGSADVGRPGLTLSGSGDGTYYDPGVGTGACGELNNDHEFVAALNAPQFGVFANPANSPVCGACIKINGPKGSVKVKIMDKCPVCKSGDVDLSPVAFNKIANEADGRVKITWTGC